MTKGNHKTMNKSSIRTAIQFSFAMAALIELSGCASSADPKAMTIAPQASEKAFPDRLQHAMCVRNVTGGEKTNALWVSKVDSDGFKTALSASLDGTGLSAPAGNCPYPIDVNLLGLSQPAAGFDLTVTSHVNYKVYDSAGEPYLLETIDAPFTASAGDAFLASERLKLANEGSIRESIKQFFDKLRDTAPK